MRETSDEIEDKIREEKIDMKGKDFGGKGKKEFIL